MKRLIKHTVSGIIIYVMYLLNKNKEVPYSHIQSSQVSITRVKQSDTSSDIADISSRFRGGSDESDVNTSELISESEEKILHKITISQDEEVVGDVPYPERPIIIKKVDKAWARIPNWVRKIADIWVSAKSRDKPPVRTKVEAFTLSTILTPHGRSRLSDQVPVCSDKLKTETTCYAAKPGQNELVPKNLVDIYQEHSASAKRSKAVRAHPEFNRQLNNLRNRLAAGMPNPGLGSRYLGEGLTEYRGENVRIIVRQGDRPNDIEIVAEFIKPGSKKTQTNIINEAKKQFGRKVRSSSNQPKTKTAKRKGSNVKSKRMKSTKGTKSNHK